MKKTKIICSIGPSSSIAEVMTEMVNNGMNVARINFSHATIEERENVVNVVKEVRNITGKNIGILYDTKGPEFRSGSFIDNEILLEKGSKIRVVKEEVIGNNKLFCVNHPEAIECLNINDSILLENGLMKVQVISKECDGVTCEVINGGILGNKKSISVPGVKLNIPFISEEDYEDIKYACLNEGDFIALSFVSSKQDVLEARKILKEYNREDMMVISKIESITGIENLEEIIEVSDGIMVARGDLGVEVPLAELPHYQKKIVETCRQKGTICIVATEMLESMKKNIRPTRAEVSDVANAVVIGADAVMLSGETTTGKYPIETVKAMSDICESAEKYYDYKLNVDWINKNVLGAIATSVVETANILDVKAIVSATISGKTAKVISNLRPKCLILAPCVNDKIARSLSLNWGVYPVLTNIHTTTDEIVKDGKEKAIQFANLKEHELIIITGGFTNDTETKDTNFMKIEAI